MNFKRATENLVAELNNIESGSWHSVYMQTRNFGDGQQEEVIMVHLRPTHLNLWKDRAIHHGYRVELHPWPIS